MSTAPDQALESASWNLEPLVGDRGAEGVVALLEDAGERAGAFAERYRGTVADLDASGLAAAMNELGEISDLAGRAGSYAMLSFTLDTADPERGALLQRGREMGARIETDLLFFELEWNELPDERAAELLADDGARLLPPLPGDPPALPPPPALRAGGEGDDRDVRDRARRPSAGCSRSRRPRSRWTFPGRTSRCRSSRP